MFKMSRHPARWDAAFPGFNCNARDWRFLGELRPDQQGRSERQFTSDPAIVALQKKYGVLGLPAVRFVTAAGQPLQETQGFVAAPEFLQVMQAAKAAAGA